MAEAQLQIEHYWAGALRRAVVDGDVAVTATIAIRPFMNLLTPGRQTIVSGFRQS